jgi:hypothetical protein
MEETNGIAARVLRELKVDLEQTRKEILKEITPIFPGDDAPEKQG